MPPTNAQYAKINIACKELGINKYDLIADRYNGMESTKQLTPFQTHDLLDHLKTLGFKVKRKKKSKTSPVYIDGQHRKIVALWITLADAGVVRNRSDQALQKYVRRMTGIENLKWCDDSDCYTLIEALKSWCLREDIDID